MRFQREPVTTGPFNKKKLRSLSAQLRSDFPSETVSFVGANIDWMETPTEHVFKGDVPGLRKKEVEDGWILQVNDERNREQEEKGNTWHRVKRSSGKFLHRFWLPENAKVEYVDKSTMESTGIERKKDSYECLVLGN